MDSLDFKAHVFTNFKLNSNLYVGESVYITSNIDVIGLLTVCNDVNFIGQLSVSNDVTINSNLQVLEGISGDGSNLSNLNADNINQGTLLVSYGGTGRNSFTANKILIGNDSNTLQEASNLHWDSDNSYLGIGTSNPSSTLDVMGDFHVSQGATVDGQLECLNGFAGDGSNLSNLDVNNVSSGILNVEYGGTGQSNLEQNKLLVGNGNSNVNAETNLHYDTTNTRLGIGTSSPQRTLHVEGDMRVTSNVKFNSNLYMDGFIRLSDGTTLTGENDLRPSELIQDNSNIGIGTSNPQYKLDVHGDMSVTSNAFFGSNVTIDSNLEVSGNALVHGNLTVYGSNIIMNTEVTVTDEFRVENAGTGPALMVNQSGANVIAKFLDDSNIAMIIADEGLVGIGTANPSQKLHVVGNALIDSNVQIDGTLQVGNTATMSNTLTVLEQTILKSNLTVNGDTTLSNNLGVDGNTTLGTTTITTLTVSSGISGDGSNLSNLDVNNVSSGILNVEHGGTGQSNLEQNKLLVGNGNSNVNAETNLHYDTTNTRLGIGTSSPGYSLDVTGDMHVTSNAVFDNDITAGSNIILSDTYKILSQNDLRPSEIHQVNEKIGIGESNPQYELDVLGSFHVSSNAELGGSLAVHGGISGDGQAISNLDVDNVAYGVLNVEFGGTGNSNLSANHVLIGNGTSNVIENADLYFDVTNKQLAVGHSNPSYTLDVNGTIYASNDFYWSGSRLGIGTSNPQFELDVQGTIYASEDVQYASDRRLKSDIQPIDNVMERMAGVRGHKFKRTDLGEDKKDVFHIGFIAQELQKVVPECVGYSKDIDQYHVSYGNMVALLAEAFHNVHDRLVQLEKHCEKI